MAFYLHVTYHECIALSARSESGIRSRDGEPILDRTSHGNDFSPYRKTDTVLDLESDQ